MDDDEWGNNLWLTLNLGPLVGHFCLRNLGVIVGFMVGDERNIFVINMLYSLLSQLHASHSPGRSNGGRGLFLLSRLNKCDDTEVDIMRPSC